MSSAQAIGSYFNVGHALLHPGRREPHLLSTQTFFLGGVVGEPDPFPLDQLVSRGLEHGDADEDQLYTGAVLGGTGRYSGARGHVVQRAWGHNTTDLVNLPVPFTPKSPNFRYAFYLLD